MAFGRWLNAFPDPVEQEPEPARPFGGRARSVGVLGAGMNRPEATPNRMTLIEPVPAARSARSTAVLGRPIYPRPAMERAREPLDLSADERSQAWLAALRGGGARRDQAIARLHALLLSAARFELGRRRTALSYVRAEELEDIATQAANDALVAVLAKLDDYRGASRFTTWAYKFAVLEAGVKLRRRAWQDREVVLDPERWPTQADPDSSAHEQLERNETLDALRAAVEDVLTPHQRQVFVALALNGVPIDVLAERLNTNRNALYKTLHDARRKLRGALAAAGLVRSEER